MSTFIPPESVEATAMRPFDPDVPFPAESPDDLPELTEAFTLSPDDFREVVGSPVSLEELKAAEERLRRLAARVPDRVRAERRFIAAVGARPGDRVELNDSVFLVTADRRLVKDTPSLVGESDERRTIMNAGTVEADGGVRAALPVPPAGTDDAGVLAAWLAEGGEERAHLARVALLDYEDTGPGGTAVHPWGWPPVALRDALDDLYDPAGPWMWEEGPAPWRPSGPPKFLFHVTEQTEGGLHKVRASNGVEALACFFKTSAERIREWMEGVDAPKYCESEHVGESWSMCRDQECGCAPIEIEAEDWSFLAGGDNFSDRHPEWHRAVEFWGKVYLYEDEVPVPEGWVRVLDTDGTSVVEVLPAEMDQSSAEVEIEEGDFVYMPYDLDYKKRPTGGGSS